VIHMSKLIALNGKRFGWRGALVFPNEYFEQPPIGTDRLTVKVWNGSSWQAKPLKRWDGSSWVNNPVRVWDLSSWS